MPSSRSQTSLWLLGLLGILGIASWFRSQSNAPSKQSVEPIQAQDNTDRNSDVGDNESGAPAGAIAVSEIPESKAKSDRAKKRRQKIRRLRKAGGTWLSLGTFVVVLAYAVIARNQWQEMIKTTEQATKSADAAQMQLEQSERAWLTLTLTADSGFTFDQAGGATINIKPHIKNVGHSVATNVTFNAELVVPPMGDGERVFREPIERQKKICDKVANYSGRSQRNPKPRL
jgi:cytoskeletal protein RodZ